MKKPTMTFGGNFQFMGNTVTHEHAILTSKTELTFSAKERITLKESDMTAENAIVLDAKYVEAIHSKIKSPLIFVNGPESLINKGSTINGKILYLSDPSTCEQYGTDGYLVDICNTHSDL